MAFWHRRKKSQETKSETTSSEQDAAIAQKHVVKESELGQLNKAIYAGKESPELQERADDLHRIGIRRELLGVFAKKSPEAPVSFEQLKLKLARRRRRMIATLIVAIVISCVIFAVTAGFVWYQGRQTVKTEQIGLDIDVPAESTAGNETVYTFTYVNNSFVDWQNVDVVIDVPRGFRVTKFTEGVKQTGKELAWKFSSLKSTAKGQVQVTGVLIGEQNASLPIQASVLLTPVNFQKGRFSKTITKNTTITSVPIEMSIDSAAKGESGEHIVAVVQMRNTSSNVFYGAYLKLKPGEGIELAPTDPDFTAGFSVVDSSWDIGTLNPFEIVQRKFVLIPTGQPGERKTVDLELGVREGADSFVQRAVTHVVTITASALTVTQSYNDQTGTLVVSPGDQVKGKLKYVNIGSTGLSNVIITLNFDGTGLNPSQLNLPQGSYDPLKRVITWTAATVPDLATLQPQQSGEIDYSFNFLPVEQYIGTSVDTGAPVTKNYTLTATTTIDSPDLFTPSGQPRKVISNRMVFSVLSPLYLKADAFYDDGRLGIKSVGPLPPAIGQETTYTVRLRLGSLLNDAGNVIMTAVLPDGVKYTNQTYVTIGKVDFNERTGVVTWTIPQLDGGTGRLVPPAELDLQVSITPAEYMLDKTIPFLNKVQAIGTDLFANQTITASLTDFPDTESAAPKKGKVVN